MESADIIAAQPLTWVATENRDAVEVFFSMSNEEQTVVADDFAWIRADPRDVENMLNVMLLQRYAQDPNAHEGEFIVLPRYYENWEWFSRFEVCDSEANKPRRGCRVLRLVTGLLDI
mmetsp:Transcript_32417/g.100310  ORF Transcript_32417/g.100310 Transcript_32417/m.100310 type:complete len:117 (+) Transcript_32417:763-1113(+)